MTCVPRPHETVVRTPAELFTVWEGLMGPAGFGMFSLWLIFFDSDGRLQPVISPIDDIPPVPDRGLLRGVAGVVEDLIATGTVASVAMLLSRPGPPDMTPADREWARALRRELGADLCRWPIHLATHGRVQIFAPDDLIGAA